MDTVKNITKQSEINEYAQRLNEFPMLLGYEKGKFGIRTNNPGQFIVTRHGKALKTFDSEERALNYLKLLYFLMKMGYIPFE